MSEIFENRQMPGASFRNVDLGGAQFDDVNLGGAQFFNINLTDATITSANLANLQIEDAYIGGMTIYGIRVDLLIEAELDRRDPMRVALRVTDPFDLEALQAVIQRLADLRTEFLAMLRASNPHDVTMRPAPDDWSALENVRHLLFAEQMYFYHWIQGRTEELSDFGLLSVAVQDLPQYANVGKDASADIEQVLHAWEALHAEISAFVQQLDVDQLRETRIGNGRERTVGGILQSLPRHQLEHIRTAEAAIARLRTARHG